MPHMKVWNCNKAFLCCYSLLLEVRCLNENTESQNTNSERQDIKFDSLDDSGKINADSEHFSMH